MLLIWRIIREAAWPGITVLIAHGIRAKIFGHEPYVDPAMHLLGGVAAAFFFTRMPRLVPQFLGELPPLTLYLFAFGLTAASAVVWEFGEFLSDVFLGTRNQRSIGNTMRDLFNGMFGAIIFIIGEIVLRSKSTVNGQNQTRRIRVGTEPFGGKLPEPFKRQPTVSPFVTESASC